LKNHPNRKIALIDDDKVFSEILGLVLKRNGYEVFLIDSAAEALQFLSDEQKVDLYIIDFDLSDDLEDGLSLCRKVKAYAKKPVIMLTGESSTDITVSCLYAGADQYIVKPYILEELLARIHVVIERQKIAQSIDEARPKLTFRGLSLNGKTREIEGEFTCVRLSERELQLAEIFFTSPETDISRSQIHMILFGKQPPSFSRAVDIIVGRLRKKLREVSDDILILSSRNSGYELVFKDKTSDKN